MKYFAYGMNTNLDEMAHRCPGATCLGPAWVDSYELCFRTHCDIAYNQASKVHGVLWDINVDNLRALDALEGYPHYYTRFGVRVRQGRIWYNALVYQMNNQNWLAEPSQFYLVCVREGYTQNNVPQKQIDDALNMVSCYLSTKMKTESNGIWSPMIGDYV